MIETAMEHSRPTQLTDSTFNAVAKALRGAEPGLTLPPFAFVGLVAALGQTHPANTQPPRLRFIFRRVKAPVTAQFTRSSAKDLPIGNGRRGATTGAAGRGAIGGMVPKQTSVTRTAFIAGTMSQ